MAVNSLILDSKKTFYNDKIDCCDGDQKEFFKIIDKIMHNYEEPQLPSHNSLDELVNKFADFLVTKISEIRKQVINNSTSNTCTDEKIFSPELLADSYPASENEIKKLIKESPSKSCSLDPIPTWLIKKCIDYLVPIITVVINLSLSSGNMPSNLKQAILIPLIKKACLDPEIFNHFRPISNLTYLSKLIEKVVATRLFDNMTTNGLHECQSSYKKYHSTETALTCIHDDILRAVDEKQCVILLLLDLSAAFDTIDHDVTVKAAEIRRPTWYCPQLV